METLLQIVRALVRASVEKLELFAVILACLATVLALMSIFGLVAERLAVKLVPPWQVEDSSGSYGTLDIPFGAAQKDSVK